MLQATRELYIFGFGPDISYQAYLSAVYVSVRKMFEEIPETKDA
jgi:hypothetical protein